MVMRGERANAYNMPSILWYSYTCKSLDVVWLCPSFRDLLLMNLSLLNESIVRFFDYCTVTVDE